MRQIAVDFEVWQKLTVKLQGEEDTYNNVLRRLLEMKKVHTPPPPVQVWQCRGGDIPIGTLLRARYKRELYEARVAGPYIEYAGRRFCSPSEAAKAVTGKNINGWTFWQAQPPGSNDWRSLTSLR